MRERRVIIAACAALLLVGTAGVFLMRSPGPAGPSPIAPPPAQPVASVVAAPATVPAATASPARATATTPDSSAARKRLQQRLDALALAYEKGDWSAAQRAMWPNHAVVRPNGEHLERADIRDAWQEEWEALTNRALTFYVESFDVKGNVAAAQWTVLLTADLTEHGGEVHHMMINGTQTATLIGDGDEQYLDGAIVYTAFERTLDGTAWPTD